jgi:hypothetical protein
MNEFSHTEHGFDPQVLDRLIDGELADGERRVLLESLERQPDGWRQCALAFLEAQTWGQTLTDYVREPNGSRLGEADEGRGGDAAVRGVAAQAAALPSRGFDGEGNVPAERINGGPANDSARREAARSNRIRTALAIAGSFLVTFSLGMYAQRYLRTSDEIGSAPSVAVPGRGNSQQAPKTFAAGPVQYASFDIIGRDGRRQTILAPLVDRDFAQMFVPPQAPQAPDYLVQQAKQWGGQVRFHREFLPVPIVGRQALVPFDRFEIVPVNNVVR